MPGPQLSPEDALAVLHRRLLADERRWRKGVYGTTARFVGPVDLRTLEGAVIDALDPDKIEEVECFCLVGGVREVFTGCADRYPYEVEGVFNDTLALLASTIDPDFDGSFNHAEEAIVSWNDAEARTVDEVIGVVAKAAGL